MSVYACSDLHGRKDLYLKIKEMLNKEDKVYFLGDAGDRGPDGWELIKLIYEDPQFVYIKGNHEDMFVDAANDCVKGMGYLTSRNCQRLIHNGGEKTLGDWWSDGKSVSWIKKIDKLPTYELYKNSNDKLVILSHAGFTPWNTEDCGDKLAIPDDLKLIWDRNHILDGWNDKECVQNCVVVHGHTPNSYIADDLRDKKEGVNERAYWYCDGHKAGIDCCSYLTGITCLLNLDTFEDIIIKIKN